MKLENKSLRVGAVVIVFAILLRLFSGGVLGRMAQIITSPAVASFLLYLETGKVVRLPEEIPQETTQQSEPEQQPENVPPEPPAQAVFSAGDAGLVQVNNLCGYTTDVQALLTSPLVWNLSGDAPTVLILHSHGSESYTKTEDYTESSDYRTLDERYNMISIGALIAECLEQQGISVIHDKTLHDYPSYSGSYDHARTTIEAYLEQYPTIALVLDIHRDAMENSAGEQIGSTVEIAGQSAAQLMLVVGSDAGGLNHPGWQNNMALAVKLHAQLEKTAPGICRPISFRSQRFNQDLSAGAVLVEVGAAGNTRQEALAAAQILAQGIGALAGGTA